MDLFRALDRAFEAELTAGRLEHSLTEWGSEHDLGGVRSLDELIECCRGPQYGTRRQKDAIAVALCLRARQNGDERAALLLSWLFLPGIAQLHQNLRPSSVLDDEELASDLFAGFWEAVSRVTATSRYVARFLLLGARRRAKKSIRRASRSGVVTLDVEPDDPTCSSPAAEVDDWIERALREGVVSRSDVVLIFSTRATISATAARFDLSLGAAQQARQRARMRLARWLESSARF